MILSLRNSRDFLKALDVMTELAKGFRSGEEKGWLTDEDLDRHFARRTTTVFMEEGSER